MKNKVLWILASIIGALIIVLIVLAVFIGISISQRADFDVSISTFLWIFLAFDLLFIVIGAVILIRKYNHKYLINSAMNYYIDNTLKHSGIGVIIYDYQKNIIWESDFVREILGYSIVSKNVISSFNFINFNKISTTYWHKYNKHTVEITLFQRKNLIVFKDVSPESNLAEYYNNQRIVIGEVEIDNFQYYRSLLNEEQLFFMQTAATEFLENASKTYNFFYRQYAAGKYIIITYEESLNKMIDNKFEFINKLQDWYSGNKTNVQLTISVGIASSYYELSNLLSMANNALQLTQNRGGNQVTILRNNMPNLYFGSQKEISVDTSRTKTNRIATRLKETLKQPKVDNVFVYGHQISDLDSIGSSFGLWYIAKELFNKNAYVIGQSYDKTTQNMLEHLKNESAVLYKQIISAAKAKDMMTKNSIIIMTDVNDPNRTEQKGFFKKATFDNIFIIDHHRVSDRLNFLNLLNAHIDPYASSASEIVTDIYQTISQNKKMDPAIAQLLLNGIYTDTNKFRKATSSKTFDASSFLEWHGAQTNVAFEYMKHTEESEVMIRQVLANTQEVRPGYFLAYVDRIMPSDTISIAADEILQVYGRKAAFVVGKIDNETYKLSARSVNINVQIIAESLGGGGHFNSSAVVSKENLSQFIDNIKQAIYSAQKEE